MKKKTILILGASGLIGGVLYKKFSNKDYDILGCDLKKNKAKNATFYKTDASGNKIYYSKKEINQLLETSKQK